MKKKTSVQKISVPAKTNPDGFAPIIIEVLRLIQSARHAAASTVNTLQVLTNRGENLINTPTRPRAGRTGQ